MVPEIHRNNQETLFLILSAPLYCMRYIILTGRSINFYWCKDHMMIKLFWREWMTGYQTGKLWNTKAHWKKDSPFSFRFMDYQGNQAILLLLKGFACWVAHRACVTFRKETWCILGFGTQNPWRFTCSVYIAWFMRYKPISGYSKKQSQEISTFVAEAYPFCIKPSEWRTPLSIVISWRHQIYYDLQKSMAWLGTGKWCRVNTISHLWNYYSGSDKQGSLFLCWQSEPQFMDSVICQQDGKLGEFHFGSPLLIHYYLMVCNSIELSKQLS